MVLEADSSSALNVSIAKSEVSSTVTVSLEYEYLEQESEPDDGERDGKVEEIEANTGQDVYTIEMQADEAEKEREDGGGDVQNSEVYPEEPPAQAKTPVVLIWDCMVNRKPAKKIAVCDKCGNAGKMERPKREDFDKICRLCLKSASLVNIFDRNPKTQQESLSTLVRETVEMLGLTIDPDDNFPRKMCLPCKDSLRSLYKFRNQCQEANDLILEVLSCFELTVAQEAPSKLTVSVPEVQPKLSEECISVKATSTLIKEDIPAIDDHDEPVELSEQMVLEADSSSALNVSIVKSEAPSTVTVSEEYEYLEQESEPDDGERDGKVEEMEANAGQDVYTIEMQADEAEEEREDGGGDVQNFEVYLEENSGSDEEEEAKSEDQSEQLQVATVKRGSVKGQLCTICNKYSTCLKYHMMYHTGERPYSCPHCEKSFRTSTKLKIHVDGVHLKLRKFTCEVCNKKFLDAGNLKSHMATHAETRKYVCDYENCGKAFALPGTLRVHKLTHTQDKQFECSFCHKSFLYKWLLVKHERSHTGEKPYECEVCHKRFSTSTHAKTHQKIHDPFREKPAKAPKKKKRQAGEESDDAVEIDPSGPYPRKICQVCKDFLRALHKFRQQAQEANDLVMEACPGAVQDMQLALPAPARSPPLILPRPQIPSPSVAVVVKNERKNVSQKSPSPRATRRTSQDKPYKLARAVQPVRKTYSCHLCDFKGFSPKALSTHLSKEHPSRYTCDICGQQFMHGSGLLMHKYEAHDIRVRLRGS
ncbi:hypothetical protein quinque_008293 [Culex quinquefasciatus]